MPETRRYEDAVKWVHATATGTLLSRAGQARLTRLIVGSASAGTCTIYNSPTPAGSIVAAVNLANEGVYEYGFILSSGIAVDKTGASDITIIYE